MKIDTIAIRSEGAPSEEIVFVEVDRQMVKNLT